MQATKHTKKLDSSDTDKRFQEYREWEAKTVWQEMPEKKQKHLQKNTNQKKNSDKAPKGK